jgi:N-acetylglucosaminyl-diphospho-decaprenol L-rhamnosyltransferase
VVTIVIVNWNSGPLLRKCVASLLEYAAGCEIVIVDNASKDTSLADIRDWESSLTVVANDHNAGFAAACNQGWRAGRGELVLFLNPDTECLPGSVAALERRFEGDTSIWAVGGHLIDIGGQSQVGFNVRTFPTLGSVAAELLLLDRIWPRNPWTRRYRMTGWDPGPGCDVDQPAAACLMARRSVLARLEGFDERFHPAWFEDVDLCRRIRAAGGRIFYEPSARFRHSGAVSLKSMSREDFLRYYHDNQIRYFAKHHGQSAELHVRRLVIAGMRLRGLLATFGASRARGYRAAPAGAYRRLANRLARSGEGDA